MKTLPASAPYPRHLQFSPAALEFLIRRDPLAGTMRTQRQGHGRLKPGAIQTGSRVLTVFIIGVEAEPPAGSGDEQPARANRAHDSSSGFILKAQRPLDLQRMADLLRASVTPVQEALARLHREGAVLRASQQVDRTEPLTAGRLEHLYELLGALVDLALELAGQEEAGGAPAPGPAASDLPYADAMAGLIRSVARSQPNLELADHLIAVNERLLPARTCEPRLFTGASEEPAAMQSLLADGKFYDLRVCLHEHHRERMSRAGHLASLLAEQASVET
jgi:hypothetical protein